MAFNQPWATAAEIAGTFQPHFLNEDGFTAGQPLPALTDALIAQLEDVRDTFAQPIIIGAVSRFEQNAMTNVNQYLTDPTLGATDGQTAFVATFAPTAGTLLVYRDYSGLWSGRSRASVVDSGEYSLSSSTITFVAGQTEGTKIIAEYDHTTKPDTVKGWTRELAGIQFLIQNDYVGDGENQFPTVLEKQLDNLLAMFQYIKRQSQAELVIPEFRDLDWYEGFLDNQNMSIAQEVLRR